MRSKHKLKIKSNNTEKGFKRLDQLTRKHYSSTSSDSTLYYFKIERGKERNYFLIFLQTSLLFKYILGMV